MPTLQAEAISKRYGGTIALRSVDFAAHEAAVNVLIGENGAGKSTLMRILAGIEQPSAGRLLLDGEEVHFTSVRDAGAKGIGIVHQELNLCPNLTVAENIFLGCRAGSQRVLLDKAAERKETRRLLAELNLDIDPDTLLGSLRIGQQQLVEIAKALAGRCKILILDEPTSALSSAEVEILFDVIADLKRSGVAIVYISHRLDELLKIGDHVTVLRDGAIVATAPAHSISVAWIIERMLGERGKLDESRKAPTRGRPVLVLDQVSLPRRQSHAPLHAISVTLHAGETVAVYGLLGSGRTELLEVITGVRRSNSGSITFAGKRVDELDVADRVRMGMQMVPEDRQGEGLFPNLDVGENITLSNLWRYARVGVISRAAEHAAVQTTISRVGVKTPSPSVPIAALSGGNQQKVVVARALLPEPSVLLLDEPSRGVDVGARAEILGLLRQLADQGLAVIFSTSDMMEARMAADRIIVLARGEIVLDAAADEIDDAVLVAAANAGGEPRRASAC
jgi:erythritol transport system ATP-binding protein